jgi:phenylalanyl-tRNA synthetase beta chain
VFDDGVEFEEIHESVSGLGIAALRSFVPVEILHGQKDDGRFESPLLKPLAQQIGAEKYSILLRAKLQSSERTLRDDEVAQWVGRIAKALEAIGGLQRA